MPEKKTAATPARKGFTAKPQPELEGSSGEEDGSMATLQSELAAQAAQIEAIQTKLYQAEAAARHLADLNQTLMEENEALKQAAKAAAPVASPTAAIVAKPRAAASLMHPVFPNGALPSGMGDQELGWFD